ncbi:MAG: DICT sensory domain-containing protein [Actinomycetes bacterium]
MTIKQVGEKTGLAPGTIRMWEHRYGFPDPARSESGYRHYGDDDVARIRSVIAYRDRGLTIPAAIERVLASDEPAEASIYAAVATAEGAPKAQVLRKSTLHALSRAMEHEALAQGAKPICFGAFQHEGFYRPVEHRYRQIARSADATVVFADFDEVRNSGQRRPVEIPIAPEDALGNEWVVIVDSPGYSACLLAWEQAGDSRGGTRDQDRRFEALWTVDPKIVRRASEVATRLAARRDPDLGEKLDGLLAARPIGGEDSSAVLTALTNRIVAYVEAS